MRIDYRRYLENAARQMILIHRADTLIKLILRTIMRATGVQHAGILVYDKARGEYVVKVSRGLMETKVPSGLIKIKPDNPIIRFFSDPKINFPKQWLLWHKVSSMLTSSRNRRDIALLDYLNSLKFNLDLFEAKACVPAFFRDELVAVLFLGRKRDNKVFSEDELSFLSALASDTAMAIKNAWLVGDLSQQLNANKRLLLDLVAALASSIEAKDKYTKGHTERVVHYSLDIAYNIRRSVRIKDWEEFVNRLKISALLHDIGKIGIPETILNKPAALDESERKTIQKHPMIGVDILKHIAGFQDVLTGVRNHHERFDGCGYPDGLKGPKIPLIAAIITLADSFDAMTTDRPYRRALTLNQALEEVKKNKGKQFAPKVVEAFLRIKPLTVLTLS